MRHISLNSSPCYSCSPSTPSLSSAPNPSDHVALHNAQCSCLLFEPFLLLQTVQHRHQVSQPSHPQVSHIYIWSHQIHTLLVASMYHGEAHCLIYCALLTRRPGVLAHTSFNFIEGVRLPTLSHIHNVINNNCRESTNQKCQYQPILGTVPQKTPTGNCKRTSVMTSNHPQHNMSPNESFL